ncbi:MAG TPA: hypothetical protein VGO25_01870 [Rhodanobacteraceae bacterium]|jgi:hypothetical protein|nr:hypothetical protein [Rhodanobacteraceae bacterium]
MQPFIPELTVCLAILGAALLAYAIVRLLAAVRASVIVRLPAVSEQDVTFAQVGQVVLYIEAMQFSTAFAGVDFAMRDAAGREVPSAPILFRTKVSGFSRVRLSVRAFDIARPGRYRLIATGIAPGRDMSQSALVFARPFVGTMVLWILAIVLGGIALIGGTVLTALHFAGKL